MPSSTVPRRERWSSGSKGGTGEALVSVQDSGPGIDPEHVPHLFDRFYRASTRSSGLGLGLYISRILVEAHGGRIWAESQPGQGSTFTVALPLHS